MVATTLPRPDQIHVPPAVARQAQDAIAEASRHPNTQPVEGAHLGRELSTVLNRVLTSLAQGHAVTIATIPEVLTSTVAAEMIGVSRTTLMRHARAGDIPHHKVGTHTRFNRDDVLKFKADKLARQRAALAELLALEDELEIT